MYLIYCKNAYYLIFFKGMKSPMLAPSLLSADFGNLEKAIKQIEENNGSVVHIDVMDGQFQKLLMGSQSFVQLEN